MFGNKNCEKRQKIFAHSYILETFMREKESNVASTVLFLHTIEN